WARAHGRLLRRSARLRSAAMPGVSVLAAGASAVRGNLADDLGRIPPRAVPSRRLVRAAGPRNDLLPRRDVARGAARPLPGAIRLDQLHDALTRGAPDRGVGEIAADVVVLDLSHAHEARRLARRRRLDEGRGPGQDAIPDLAH